MPTRGKVLYNGFFKPSISQIRSERRGYELLFRSALEASRIKYLNALFLRYKGKRRYSDGKTYCVACNPAWYLAGFSNTKCRSH